MKTRNKIDFIHKYVNHLWKCYKDIKEVARRLDNMMMRLY